MLRSKIVLIVDDDADDRYMFREALHEINPDLQCLESENGSEALRILNNPNVPLPDFIFLDLNMPPLNGFQFLKEIKRQKNLCHIPVIIYSTSRRPEDVEETKKSGAEGFISKPDSFEEICKQVGMTLKQHNYPVSVSL